MYKFKKKEDQLAQLNKQSDLYEFEAMNKIQELRDAETYRDCLGKQSEIDDYYVKSLKMKIASAQIS